MAHVTSLWCTDFRVLSAVRAPFAARASSARQGSTASTASLYSFFSTARAYRSTTRSSAGVQSGTLRRFRSNDLPYSARSAATRSRRLTARFVVRFLRFN